MMTKCAYIVLEDVELEQKSLEVTEHPAWHGLIDDETCNALLQNAAPMTYLLRQDTAGEFDYWISLKDEEGVIRHRHFAIRLHPDGWMFRNTLAPTCEYLSDFIQGALACKDF